jgi:hypothetical protein
MESKFKALSSALLSVGNYINNVGDDQIKSRGKAIKIVKKCCCRLA